MCVYIYIYIHTYRYIYIYIYIYTCISIYIYIYIYRERYIYICIYVYTHTINVGQHLGLGPRPDVRRYILMAGALRVELRLLALTGQSADTLGTPHTKKSLWPAFLRPYLRGSYSRGLGGCKRYVHVYV